MREVNIKLRTKVMWIIIAVILVLAIATSILMFALNYYNYGEDPAVEDRAHNVILLIGDGMGKNHIKTAEIYHGSKLFMNSKLTTSGEVITHSLSLGATDSAAAATAMATGKKVKNGQIAWHSNENIASITEYAQSLGKRTGIVTTKPAYDATPAAFSAHTKSRSNSNDIVYQQVHSSNLNVLMGLGKSYYDPFADVINTPTRDYVNNFADLNASSKDDVYAIFEDDAIATLGTNTLATMTERALDKLTINDNEDGFFLMVEGARIDSYSHDNEIKPMIEQLLAFDDAVAVAYNFAKKHPNTTVIVTADHETGNLKIPNPKKEANEEGELVEVPLSADDIDNSWFKKTGHTTQNVVYYAFGPGAKAIPSEIDNTDIYEIISQLIS